jgi:hypothetical protein
MQFGYAICLTDVVFVPIELNFFKHFYRYGVRYILKKSG